ncbi:MAG: hypothetical protein HXX13_05110 [Bacteroidetes bacterium]|nr:hypothetical protein [Bacteroidota bacterium]
MNQENTKNLSGSKLSFLIACLVITISFFFFSNRFYPLLNSDDGISILMIHYFDWKSGLYFWGQDRLGSLVPFLGRLIYILFHPNAILAESISHYLIMAAGYFAISTFLRSPVSRIILCIIWFFPPFHMIEIHHNALGLEYSVLGIGLYFMHRSLRGRAKTSMHRLFFFAVSFIFFILAIWVSDLDLVSIAVVFGIILWYKFKSFHYNPIRAVLNIPVGYYLVALIGVLSGAMFIAYCKSVSLNTIDYQSLAGYKPFVQTSGIFLQSMWSLFIFKAGEPFTSIYLYLVVGFGIVLVVCVFSNEKIHWSPVTLFFALQTIILLLVVLSSKWVLMNEVGRRYFISIYLSIWITLLLLLEKKMQSGLKKMRWISFSLLLIAIFGGSGTILHLRYIWPGTLTPKYTILKEFKDYGNIGVIGNYWNSYVISSIDPDHIVASTSDEMFCRKKELTPLVFKQERLFIVRDGWFEHFPDTMFLYNHVLQRKSEEKMIGDCFACEYKVLRDQ